MLSWHHVAPLLATEIEPTSESPKGRRCAIKLLDTAFLSLSMSSGRPSKMVNVDSWLYTSKKGEMTKKKRDHLNLNKVYERFTRFALANPDNASSQKFVAVVHPRGDGPRRIMDHSQLQSAAESNETEGAPLLADCSALQCYLRPEKGKDELHRVTFSSGKISIQIVSNWMRNGIGRAAPIKYTSMNSDVTSELSASASKLEHHLQLATAKKVSVGSLFLATPSSA